MNDVLVDTDGVADVRDESLSAWRRGDFTFAVAKWPSYIRAYAWSWRGQIHPASAPAPMPATRDTGPIYWKLIGSSQVQ